MNSVADFGSQVWLNSNHTNVIDVQLNETMRIVTGTVRATPVMWLPVLSNIVPAELRRKKSLDIFIFKAERHKNSILFEMIQEKTLQRLKSREPIWKNFDAVKNFDINRIWTQLWNEASVFGYETIDDPTKKANGTELERSTWVTLNQIRTHKVKCGSCLFKWGIIESPNCDCSPLEHCIAHITMFFPLRYFSGSFEELCTDQTSRALDWLQNLDIVL